MSQEHDRVREELSALPRPTMPTHVAERLDLAIAAAVASATTEDPAAATAPTPTGSPVQPHSSAQPDSSVRPLVPKQATGGRRTGRRALLAFGGVAAAMLLFTAVDPATTTPDQPIGIAAAPEQTDLSAGTADADRTVIEDLAAIPLPSTEASGPVEAALAEVLTASTTSYSRADLTGQATAAVSDPGPLKRTEAPWSHSTFAADSPAATMAGVRACVSALPSPQARLMLVDQAQFEGAPALVVVRDQPGNALEIIVQAPTCTAEDPAIQYRTTVIP